MQTVCADKTCIYTHDITLHFSYTFNLMPMVDAKMLVYSADIDIPVVATAVSSCKHSQDV